MKSDELFAKVLQDIKSSRECEPGANYQELKACAPLIWVANSFYEIVHEEEINSLESLDKYLEAIRFQFPKLNSQSTGEDEHWIELLEQCLSEARAAGLGTLQILNQ